MKARRVLGMLVAGLVAGRLGEARAKTTLTPGTPAVIEASNDGGGAPALPWVKDADSSWKTAAPFAHLQDAGVSFTADLWLATTDNDCLAHVVVHDAHHAPRSGDELWQGDFMRIAIDGRGDGTMGAPVETAGPFGPDDIALGLGLTPEGPLALVMSSGAHELGKRLPAGQLTASRSDADGTTTYDLALPWKSLHVMPGARATFGVAVRVKNVTPDKPDEYLQYGDGANGLLVGKFKTLAFAPAPHPFVAAEIVNQEVWNGGTPAEIAVAVSGDKPVRLRARGGKGAASITVAAGAAKDAQNGVKRFRVLYTPAPGDENARLSVDAQSAGKNVLSIETTLVEPDRLFTRLFARLDQLTAEATHPLFVRHLRSVRALAETERARVEAYRNNPALVRETVGHIQALVDGFAGDAGSWDAYLDGRRSLLFAFVSRRDASVQSYYVTLPKGYDVKKSRDEQSAYPVFFELHGAGNPHPLGWVASELGGHVQAKDLLGYESPKNFASMERVGYHVQPFGRGNSGYVDIGEIDVLEALADAEKTFKIDPDRRYLYGFSMGGAGTWHLGSRTPDHWAAMAIYGASPDPSAALGLARNVRTLPVWHWIGEEDPFSMHGNRAFNEELRRRGVALTASSTPKLGHAYIPEKQKEGVQWLQKFVRARPDNFSYVSDTPEHRGAWGVTMDRDLTVSGAPSFDCSIASNVVRIDSHGTPALDVDLGDNGLRLHGTVTVIWNGKSLYTGPVKTIRLPVGAPPRAPEGRRSTALAAPGGV